MEQAIADPRVPIKYVGKFREYALVVDADTLQVIMHCPWCGAQLPRSLRDEFFDQLEKASLEPDDANVPIDFRSDAWWRVRGIE
jgi:hypothetical protein